MNSSNTIIRETISVTGQATVRPSIVSLQEYYHLSALEFYKIKKDDSALKKLSWLFFFGWVSQAIPPAIKFAQCIYNRQEYPTPLSDHLVQISLLAISILLYLLSFIFPSERSKILKKIDKHFTNKPEQQGVIND
jgi:hypothetical protein